MMSSYRIVEHDPQWAQEAADEGELIARTLGVEAERVEHIGSTSVPGLAAKPIIDLVVGVDSAEEYDRWVRLLAEIGYECREETVPGTPYDRKASPRRFNAHLTVFGNDFWMDHILFRDYLRNNPDTASEYEELKREVMAEFASVPLAYNNGKSDFIQGVVEAARTAKSQGDSDSKL